MYNFIDIQLPQSETKTILSYRTVLTMGRYQHQHLTMYVKNWGLNYSDIKTGSPVKVTYSSANGSQEFVGYIHSVTPDLATNKHFVEITAVGASYTMKQASQNAWSKVTADQVITQIAKKHQFAYHSTPHGRVYDNLLQVGETDWEFACSLAIRSGYTLRADGTTLYFDPVNKDFTDYQASAPYFIMRATNDPLGYNLFHFTPEISEANEHEGYMKAATAVGGIDLTSGSSIVNTNQTRPSTSKASSQPEFFDRFHTNAVIPNSTVALYEAIAADERNKFPYRGKAEVLGDARIRPDLPVFIDGVGKDYSGYWTVLECTHIFKEHLYTVEMVLGTDSLGQVSSGTAIPGPTAVRVINPATPSRTKPVPSKLSINTPTINNSSKSTGFGLATNRKQPVSVRSSKATSPKWVNTAGDIRTSVPKSNATAATVNKLRSAGVR